MEMHWGVKYCLARVSGADFWFHTSHSHFHLFEEQRHSFPGSAGDSGWRNGGVPTPLALGPPDLGLHPSSFLDHPPWSSSCACVCSEDPSTAFSCRSAQLPRDSRKETPGGYGPESPSKPPTAFPHGVTWLVPRVPRTGWTSAGSPAKVIAAHLIPLLITVVGLGYWWYFWPLLWRR